jgi:CRISPR system Cascade subunit CasD
VSAWLLIALAAPLASFGEDAGNARRGSADRPTRSALLGLAGAALGVERSDATGQAALSASFLIATRTLSPGAPLSDFHTFQSLPAAKGPAATRAQALSRRDALETSITRRDYRADGLWQAAYAECDGARFTLAQLREAFLRPRFALWAGRKSCPFSRPLAPLIVDTAEIAAAFVAHARRAGLAEPKAGTAIALDVRLAPPQGANQQRRHRRVDEPGDRERWHFAARYETVFPMSAPAPEKDA